MDSIDSVITGIAIAIGFGIGAYIRDALLIHSDPEWYRGEQLTQRWRNYGRHLGRYLRR